MGNRRNALDRLKIDEVVAILRMNREKIIRRLQRGDLEGGKLMDRWYVERWSVEKFLRKMKREASAA